MRLGSVVGNHGGNLRLPRDLGGGEQQLFIQTIRPCMCSAHPFAQKGQAIGALGAMFLTTPMPVAASAVDVVTVIAAIRIPSARRALRRQQGRATISHTANGVVHMVTTLSMLDLLQLDHAALTAHVVLAGCALKCRWRFVNDAQRPSVITHDVGQMTMDCFHGRMRAVVAPAPGP